MFKIFGKLRALCSRNREPVAMRMARTTGPRSVFQGKASPVRRRPGAIVRHLPTAAAAFLLAPMAAAFPPPSDYVETVTAEHEQRIALVRAAFHATHHPLDWAEFDPASVFAVSSSDRVSIEALIGGNSLQRKNAVDAILGPYARLVMDAYYPAVVITPGF